MITNGRTAKQVSDLMLDITAQLNQSVSLVQEQASAEEFASYRLAVARIMGEILLEVLNPLYRKHPGLKPEGLQ